MSRIFSLFFIVVFTAFSAAAADSSTYLVEGINVNVTSKSPSGARNSAVATARRDAFLVLLTRLDMKINIADTVSDDEISDMVRSEQIDNEKMAGNTYSATFNIMFAKDFVDHILTQKEKGKSEQKTEIVEGLTVLLPAKMIKRRALLWEDGNDWKKAIERNLVKKSKTQFVIPNADVSTIAIVNRDNVALIDYTGLEPLLQRYRSDSAYSLIFSYDEIENKVTINVFYIRKLQKKQIKLSFINVDRLSYEALLDKVADKTIEYLMGARNNDDKVLSSNVTRIGIYIGNLGNWLGVKNKIEGSNLVSQLNIESISRDYVVISVNYVNGQMDIQEAFTKIGLSLDKKADNFYTLNAN